MSERIDALHLSELFRGLAGEPGVARVLDELTSMSSGSSPTRPCDCTR